METLKDRDEFSVMQKINPCSRNRSVRVCITVEINSTSYINEAKRNPTDTAGLRINTLHVCSYLSILMTISRNNDSNEDIDDKVGTVL